MLLRGVIVIAICTMTGVLLGFLLSQYFDNSYRATGKAIWHDIFYFLSGNRVYLISFGNIAVFLLASGWIFRPYFTEHTAMYSKLLKEHIHLKNDLIDDSSIQLPEDLKPFEDVLNNVNAEIRLSKYAAKEAEQRKNDLVVYLAHDIRTPLTSVLGYLELLIENRDLPEVQRQKFMDSALRKARRMQGLVEELFEITRYSITQIELEKSPVNLSMMLTQLVEELKPVLERRQIEAGISQTEAVTVFVDADKLARSLDNILHNAAFYTPPGGRIKITLDKADTRARVRISNTGMEIPPEKLARFFEKFYRGEEARQSESGGSGLGLAIAKSIIEAHGGSISAENRDQITTFTIWI